MAASSVSNSSFDDKLFDVIVVGLGPAGIAAISKLRQYRLNILGLEASQRTGGRVHTVNFGNGVVDLGAEWCHGEDDNVVFDLVKDLNLLESSGTVGLDKVTYMDSEGKQLSPELCEKLCDLCCETTTLAKFEMENGRASLGHMFIKVYEKLLQDPKYASVPKEIAELNLQWFHKYENSLEASDTWFDTSGSSYSEYHDCGGDPLLHWKGRGYRTILDILMKTHPLPYSHASDDKFLNKEVMNIEWKDDNDRVKVTCKDDSVYYAKHVIVTVSLGVLKDRYETMFTPPLPSDKVNSIKNLIIGTVDKMFMCFETKWWSDTMKWVALLWNDEAKDKLPENDKWLSDVFAFNSNDGQPNVLCLWVTGPSARYMETLPENEVKEKLLNVLNMFFGKEYKISPLVDFTRTQWNSNPLFRGSYTFRGMRTEFFSASSAQLATPILNKNGKPVVCFAGEATSPHYYSTVHGAVESGFRESARICNYMDALESNITKNKRTSSKL